MADGRKGMVVKMTKKEICEQSKAVLETFCVEGEVIEFVGYGNGHINDTFLVKCKNDTGVRKYIFQRVNSEVFANPEALMENSLLVTSFLKEKIKEKGGDPSRQTQTFIPNRDGNYLSIDATGNYWRLSDFIEGTSCLDQARDKEDFYQSAVSFGEFQGMLADFDASRLHETIPDFHNTPARYQTFLRAVEEDVCGRRASVEKEIDFFVRHKEDMEVCANKLSAGELPLRVTHNDTKLNNILIDNATGKGICVIDLDTVMPGLSIFDFGDSIRFGANTAAEDETDLSKVSLELDYFDAYVKGFLEGCGGSLTDAEVEMLPFGAKTMTLECGMRFLTDYLQGDTYFRIHREKQNLDRCRTQIALVEDMEKKWQQMADIVSGYCGH